MCASNPYGVVLHALLPCGNEDDASGRHEAVLLLKTHTQDDTGMVGGLWGRDDLVQSPDAEDLDRFAAALAIDVSDSGFAMRLLCLVGGEGHCGACQQNNK